MGARQKRYREARLADGWERIEVLVPAAAAPWLKAYARALRDAVTLGLPPPRFDGMGVAASPGSRTPRARHPSPAPPFPSAPVPPLPAAVTAKPVVPPSRAKARPADGPAGAPEQFFSRVADKRRREADEASKRPDFSKGLLDGE